jgi:hypothetical protein
MSGLKTKVLYFKDAVAKTYFIYFPVSKINSNGHLQKEPDTYIKIVPMFNIPAFKFYPKKTYSDFLHSLSFISCDYDPFTPLVKYCLRKKAVKSVTFCKSTLQGFTQVISDLYKKREVLTGGETKCIFPPKILSTACPPPTPLGHLSGVQGYRSI